MSGVNKAILVGNLGADPETRYTQGGQPITNFRLATGEKFTGRDGQLQDRTEWHRIVAFGKLAEQCRDYLAKGRQVYVEGRIQTRQWDDRDGNKRYTTEIVALSVRFLGGRQGERAPGQASDMVPEFGGHEQGGSFDGAPPPIADEDVPF